MKLYRTAINFIEHYRSLFLNPAENAAEIIITTALVVIGAVIIWIIASTTTSRARLTWRRLRVERNLPVVFALYLGAVAIFGAFIVAVAFPVTSNPAFCGRVCHSMNPAFQSWRRSAHAKVPCYACHIDDSFQALLYDKAVVGSREVIQEITGKYAKPINSRSTYSQKLVPSKRCLRCHSPKTRSFSVRLGLNVNHKAHSRAGMRCTTCHNRVGHPQAEKYSPLREGYSGFKYKDFNTETQGCLRCHVKGGRFVDAGGTAHEGPFRTKSGKKAQTACRTCHSALWQGLPKTHEPARGVKWGRGLAHGEAARENFQGCKGCHEPTVWCSTRCHFGITMPHVKNWVQAHPEFAKRDTKRCYACHKVTQALDFCGSRCHHDRFQQQFGLDKQTPWNSGKEQHGLVVKAVGAQPCFKCHDQRTACIDCHGGIAMPHVAGWRGSHFKYVEFVRGDGWQRDKAPCVPCHNKDGRDENYCASCHHKKYGRSSPLALMTPVRADYKAIVEDKAKKTLSCQECHELKFCTDCHSGKGDRKLIKGQ